VPAASGCRIRQPVFLANLINNYVTFDIVTLRRFIT